jgi:hypothetical protein
VPLDGTDKLAHTESSLTRHWLRGTLVRLADLQKPKKPRSQDARAVLPLGVFRSEGVNPNVFDRLCTPISGERVEVKISPGALEALAKLPDADQDQRIVRALPFAEANFGRPPQQRPRMWDTDLAMADGARTEDDVRNWRARHGLKPSRPIGGMQRP